MLVEVADLTQFYNEISAVKEIAYWAVGVAVFSMGAAITAICMKPKVELDKLVKKLNDLQLKKG